MARIFENPANGYREEVGLSDSVCVFVLGAIYLIVKGLWAHVFFWLLVVVLPSLSGAPLFVFTLPLAAIGYAIGIQGMLANRYLAKGWREVETDAPAAPSQRTAPTYVSNSVRDPYKPVPTARKCPFCAEEIKAEALKCKHCHSELPAT